MENPSIKQRRYEEERRKAETLYSMIGIIWCPVLHEYINFNRTGFEHLMRRGVKWRSKGDQMRRFKLVKYAEKIVCDEKSNFIERGGRNGNCISMRFWAISQTIDDYAITVVIRQTKMGQKHFFSIYNQKTAK